MKLKSFFIAAIALTGFAGNVVAQTDVTSTYLTNADFSTGTPIDNNVCTYGKDMSANETTYYGAQAISGWTNASVGDTDNGYANSKLAGALFEYGSTPWLAGSGTPAPATGPTGAAGNAAGLCAVWGGSIQYTQTVTFPAGSYTIVYKVYNATTNNGSGKFITTNLFGFVEDGGTTHYAPNKTFAIGQWSTVAVTFNLAASTSGKISMGFVGPSGNANMPHLFVDNVKILKNEYYTDKSSSVNATSWTTPAGNDGLQGTAFTRSDGTSVRLQASYGSSAAGRKIYQTVSGLDNGSYEVVVYAFSMNEWGNHSATLANDAGDVGYVFAEGAYELKEWINARKGTHSADDYGIYTISGVKVTDGTMTIGYALDKANQTEWQGFQVQSLIYTNPIDLSAYSDALAAAVSAADALNGLIPTAAYNNVQAVVTENNQTYTTAEDYTAATTAINNAVAGVEDLKAPYAEFYSYKATIQQLSDGQSSSDALTTFNNALSTATTNVEAATNVAAINTETATLRPAGMTYISTAGGQFDITFLASQNYRDWKKNDGSAAGIVADQFLTNRPNTIPSFAESYETTCATTGTVLYQTIENLPAGYYQVGMYAAAMFTSGRGFNTEAKEGDANRTFAFAGDLNDNSRILRTGAPISFNTVRDFNDLTTLDVNVHLASAGNLTYGVQKDANGSNWHFAQIISIVYSNQPDLTNLNATRDALVAEAEGLLNGSADYLTSAQQTALQSAITAGNNADDFESLNTVTLTTLPNAINTAKQQIQQVKTNRVLMIAALERFENDYNLADGTDYRRSTMSAEAWTDLLDAVNAVTTALDDVSQASNYGTLKDALVAQMDATDTSLRLFKSYKAMVDGTTALSIVGSYGADSDMDTDATEQAAITALNTAFGTYANAQDADFSVSAFLGENLDFSAAAGSVINGDNSNTIKNVTGWDVKYADADTWAVLQTDQSANSGKLYIRKNWGSAATTLTVLKEKMLPVGKYSLSLSWDSDMANMTNLSQYKLGETATAIGEATAGAQTLTYDFEVTTAATPFDLTIGFQKTGTGDAPAQIIVDDVTLTLLRSAEDLLVRDYDPAALWFDATDSKYAAAKGVEVTPTAVNQIIKAAAADQFSGLTKNVIVGGTCANLEITDGAPLEVQESFTATTVSYARSMSNAWGTVILPFVLTSNADVQLYRLKDSDDSDMTFELIDDAAANSPVAFQKLTNEGSVTFSATDADVSTTTGSQNELTTASGWTSEGSYTVQSIENFSGIYYIASNKFWAADGTVTLNPFRAIYRSSDNSVKRFGIRVIDTPTSISGVEDANSDAPLYNLAGQRVQSENPHMGIFIRNGKKIIIR